MEQADGKKYRGLLEYHSERGGAGGMKDGQPSIRHDQGTLSAVSDNMSIVSKALNSSRDSVFVVHERHSVFLLTLAICLSV